MTSTRDATPGVVPGNGTAASTSGRVDTFCTRHFVALALLVLGLAAFNLTFRLGQEFLTEWDESLYATTAAEALDGGHWIGTTFHGALDYYNTKPPLNVWLIALAFKTFGKGLIALRMMSAGAAWLTVAVLVFWVRRSQGAAVALVAGVVLATSFGFVHIHAGRSANTDAMFTLLVLLTVVALWAEEARPWARVWLGPLLAATFLLRGMAVLMPLFIVGLVWLMRPRRPRQWAPTLVGLMLCLLPVGAWLVARFEVDRWEFLNRLFFYDFVARSTDVIEGHPGGLLYYPNILQKHQFDWLFAGVVALWVAPIPWATLRRWFEDWRMRERSSLAVLLLVWAAVTFVEPTLMQTKLPWYLNSFYPVFAIAIAWLGVRAVETLSLVSRPWRSPALATAFLLAFVIAEGKLVWYSFAYRDLGLSDQSLVLAEMAQIAGHRVFRDQADRAGTFVTSGLAGAESRFAADPESFLHDSQPGDFLLVSGTVSNPDLDFVRSNGHYWLYRHNRSHHHGAGAGVANPKHD